jgi:hypothetical protein
MVNRTWMPSDYQDEMIPPARPSPSAWVEPVEKGGFALAAAWPKQSGAKPRPLAEGDIVSFDWTEDHGQAQFTIHPDRSWSCTMAQPTTPEGGWMNVAVLGDWDTMADSLIDFAEEQIQKDPGSRTETIVFYSWSQRSYPYEFRSGEFHPIASA